MGVNKTQGIPSTARRTRKLKLDPAHPTTVYAGTTQGLYKSTDGGTMWVQDDRRDVIVNDVYVDPNHRQHVLLATDRGGVLRSEDSGVSFQPSNDGFSLRQVVALCGGSARSRDSVCRRRERQGGRRRVCEQHGGVKWRQMSSGLGGRDVFSLTMAPDDTLLAGTSHGVFRMTNGMWTEASDQAASAGSARRSLWQRRVRRRRHVRLRPRARPEPKGPSPLSSAAVYALTSGRRRHVRGNVGRDCWRSTMERRAGREMQVPQLTDGRHIASHGQMSWRRA